MLEGTGFGALVEQIAALEHKLSDPSRSASRPGARSIASSKEPWSTADQRPWPRCWEGWGGAAGALADATAACILRPRDRLQATAAAAVVGALSGFAGAYLGWKAAVVASAIGVLGFLSDSAPSSKGDV